MASTGLLAGVNPYRGGNVAIDFTSKPTQYIIQQLQHQQAKAEATEKYYKDWEKSLNTAGIGEPERRMFTENLNKLKGYAIKNKEQINNPSKYGYDAQSTLEAGFKELQSFLEGSKQKTAEVKAYKTFTGQQYAKGKQIDGDLEVLRDATLPYGAGYIAPDTAKIKIYDPFDEKKYEQSITTGIKPAIVETSETIYDLNTKKDTGRIKKIKNAILNDDEAKKLAENSLAEYKTKLGTTKLFDNLYQDKQIVNSLNERFGEVYKYKDPATGVEIIPKIKTIEDFALAKGLAKIPKSKLVSESEELSELGKYNEWLKRHNITVRDSSKGTALENTQKTLNYLNGGLELLQGNGDTDAVNNYFKYWKSGEKGALAGAVGFDKAEKVSPGVWSIKYKILKNGVALPTSRIINTNDPAAKNILFALHQQFLGSNPKVEAELTPDGKASGGLKNVPAGGFN